MDYSHRVLVRILERAGDYTVVQLPFVDVPVQMNHEFFNHRLSNGYFEICSDQLDESSNLIKSSKFDRTEYVS